MKCIKVGCSNSAMPDRQKCFDHLAVDVQRSLTSRATRRNAGLCMYGGCSNAPLAGVLSCAMHLSRSRKYSRVTAHHFDEKDAVRFEGITHCDWCGLPFKDETPHVDHDRRCCKGRTHCWACTRGFTHSLCNSYAIAWFEWYELQTGVELPMLADYRRRFPVPRRTS
jgi:hypothetical protein